MEEEEAPTSPPSPPPPPPAHRVVVPADVGAVHEGLCEFAYVGTQGLKVTLIEGLPASLESLSLRSNLLASCSGVGVLAWLKALELYDNQVAALDDVASLPLLETLDVSCNRVRSLAPLARLTRLRALFCASNRLTRIEGLGGLGGSLEQLDLGDNRIARIEGVAHLGRLHSLWLGTNRIEVLHGLGGGEDDEHGPEDGAARDAGAGPTAAGTVLKRGRPPVCASLRRLDLQSNRIARLGRGLEGLAQLEELVLGHNGIETLDLEGSEAEAALLAAEVAASVAGAEVFAATSSTLAVPVRAAAPSAVFGAGASASSSCLWAQTSLKVLDLSANRIARLSSGSLAAQGRLEDLWLGYNRLAAFGDLALPALAASCPRLATLYLEHNPLARDWEYRKHLARALPSLVQLDADRIAR